MAEIYKLKAEHKAGEILREMPKAKGGKPYQKSYRSEVMSGREKTLAEMKITNNQSSFSF